jgi:hemoglobin-like flavoprotein
MKTQLALLALLGVLVTYCAAEEHTCGYLERVKVRRQWAHAYGDGEHRLDFVVAVWTNFFKAYPKARDLFAKHRGDNVYSSEFQAHGHRILGAIGMLLNTGDDVPTLKAMLEAMKKKAAEKGIKPEHYDAFRDELLTTLPDFVGRHFDYDAWRPCMDLIISGLK